MNAPVLRLLLVLLVGLMVAVQVRAGDELGSPNKGINMVSIAFMYVMVRQMACFLCGMGCTTVGWSHFSWVFHTACV
jgi:hypothetical protein